MSLLIYAGLCSIYLDSDYFIYPTSLFEYTKTIIIHLFIGVAGSLSILSFFNIIDVLLNVNIVILVSMTLGIYLCQSVLLETLLPIFVDMTSSTPFLIYLLYFNVVSLLVLITSLLLIKVIKSADVLNMFLLENTAKQKI